VLSLAQNPERCTLAPENGRFPYELRQLNFGVGRKSTHRIIYTIRPIEVVILRVRHLAQQEID
jgi:plasmid stabilization system protein ParE